MARTYILFKLPSLFSEIPNVESFFESTQIQARQKPVGQPLQKIRTLDVWSSPFISFQRRIRELGVFSQLDNAVLKGEIMVRKCLSFSYQFCCGWFHAHLGCRSLLTGFWISPKGNLSLQCCSMGVPMGKRRVQGSLFLSLFEIITLEHYSFSYLNVFVYIVPSFGQNNSLLFFCQISKYPSRLYSDITYCLTCS